jgi:molybdate transport system substrate-binding protein
MPSADVFSLVMEPRDQVVLNLRGGIVHCAHHGLFSDEGSSIVRTRIWKFSMTMVLVCGVAGLGMGTPARGETLTVAAAQSLRAPFQEILRMFEKEYGVPVEVRYGPSHTLRRQIEQGAPIDVFLSESLQEVETLHQKGLTLLGGPHQYAQTSMVVVMSSASAATSVSFGEASLTGGWRVALVDPKTSSVGAISVKALKQLDPLAHHHARLVPAPHTDEVVRLVSVGDADLGIVYRADAINSGQVRIIDEAPAGRSIPVVFGQAVVSTCRQASLKAAEQFVNFMMSPRIQKLLLKYGFDAMSTKATMG